MISRNPNNDIREAQETCICGREDWIYDAEIGQWCCGCGYVKHATGSRFKDGSLRLDSNRKIQKT